MRIRIFAVIAALFWLGLTAGRYAGAEPSNRPTPNPKFTSVLEEITSVDQLPLDFRYADDEWKELLAKAKAEKTASIENVKTKEVYDCEKCMVILRGLALFPPFELETTDEKIFINRI